MSGVTSRLFGSGSGRRYRGEVIRNYFTLTSGPEQPGCAVCMYIITSGEMDGSNALT